MRPSLTLITPIDAAFGVGPATVLDAPDRSNTRPTLASAGATTYVAWQTIVDGRLHIALAAYPALDAAVEVPAADDAWLPALALAAPERGAIAWTSATDHAMYVAPFEQVGSTFLFGPARAIPRVAPSPEVFGMMAGLVHVGGERYVIGWNEEGSYPDGHLYAMTIDLGDSAPRVAAQHLPKPAWMSSHRARVPCSH